MLAMLAMSMLWVNYPFASADICMQRDCLFSYANAIGCYAACARCYGSAIQLVGGAMGVISSLCRMLWECYLACIQCYAVLCSLCKCYVVLLSLYAVLSSAVQPTQVLCITLYRGGVYEAYEAMGAI